MTKICKHFFITGKVQGVFYRDTTRKKANELGLTGWVRNLADGRVELLVSGEEKRVQQLGEWLWQGPPAARVDSVIAEDIAMEHHPDFQIL